VAVPTLSTLEESRPAPTPCAKAQPATTWGLAFLVGGTVLNLRLAVKRNEEDFSKPPAAAPPDGETCSEPPWWRGRRGRGRRERCVEEEGGPGTPCRSLSLHVQCWGLGGAENAYVTASYGLCTARATSDTLRPTEVPLLLRCGLLQTAHCFAPCACLRGPQPRACTPLSFWW
jgi:hypothetical protein